MIEQVRAIMEEKQLDGILIQKRNNFSWLTGGRRNHIVLNTPEGVCRLLVWKNDIVLIVNQMEEKRIIEEEMAFFGHPYQVVTMDWFEDDDTYIQALTKEKRMGSDTQVEGFEWIEPDLSHVRSVLSAPQLKQYEALCYETACIVESVCKEILPGQTEHEIAALVAKKALTKGMTIEVLLVATDDRIHQYRHPIPTDKVLQKHALVVLCAERHGLVANVTRSVYFGQLPKTLEENKERLARIDTVMNAATRPGRTIGDVLKRGIAQYEKEGFPDNWKKLHQGGKTGYVSREIIAVPSSKEDVQLHQVFTWNPSLPGLKSEDTMVVEEKGNRFLTYTGQWVYIDIEHDGVLYKRPDLLIRHE
ncbi:M24 family metallopeptidase [Bacillus sp. 179-C3.3 HS]|uniref:M24 family metallopeptidase n=1 Tax=Bacillus sp. 179-C3.3 HS TaxID=3232162 RepID=UPI0039A2E880